MHVTGVSVAGIRILGPMAFADENSLADRVFEAVLRSPVSHHDIETFKIDYSYIPETNIGRLYKHRLIKSDIRETPSTHRYEIHELGCFENMVFPPRIQDITDRGMNIVRRTYGDDYNISKISVQINFSKSRVVPSSGLTKGLYHDISASDPLWDQSCTEKVYCPGMDRTYGQVFQEVMDSSLRDICRTLKC